MIEQKNLIKNIPNGCFHSVIMTSYSINLYYWEIQLLKALSNKGINYVSALVDADCLSEQLINFSRSFDGKKQFDFSLHGYKSKGAFHPKIQFYAGREKILVLIGSGNITISGHGKNLEVWTPLMIDSNESPEYPFVREVWNYLCSLYRDLGDEAYKIINSIKDNCELLTDDFEVRGQEYQINENYSIRLFTDGKESLFEQTKKWIGEDKIKSITVMSPFYDNKADFLKVLNVEYSPNFINIIAEDGFGTVPKCNPLPSKLRIYKWSDVKPEGANLQKYFHAKCLFFEGEKFQYCVCGSANASIAAFGKPGVNSVNREASVGYKSQNINYLKEAGFVFKNRSDFEDIKPGENFEEGTNYTKTPIWIKEASYDFGHYYVSFESEIELENAHLTMYSPNRQIVKKEHLRLCKGQRTLYGKLDPEVRPFFVELTDGKGNILSNRQFVISSYKLVINDPARENTEYRHRCYDIEVGKFISGKTFNFIEEVLSGADEKKYKLTTEEEKQPEEELKPAKKGFEFQTEEDYFRQDSNDVTGDFKQRARTLSAYRKNLVLDSIIHYIKRSATEKKEEGIDNEETEDVSRSEGRETQSQNKRSEQERVDEKIAEKVVNMLDKYVCNLEQQTIQKKHFETNKISVMDAIKPFMLALFYLYRILSYRYSEEAEGGTAVGKSILPLLYGKQYKKSDVVYVYRIISLFALNLLQSKIIDEENVFIKQKLEGYKKYVLEFCIAIISICDWLNRDNSEYDEVEDIYKKPALFNIYLALGINISSITEHDVMDKLDGKVYEIEGFEPEIIQFFIEHNLDILKGFVIGKIYKEIVRTKYGFMTLIPHEKNPDLAIPCSMVFDYNASKKLYSPYNQVYHRIRKEILGVR